MSSSLTGQSQQDYSHIEIEVGTVVRSFVDDTNPPKYKFWIVVSVSEERDELGIVYINTTPNAFLMRRQDLAKLQMLVVADHRNLVDYDCYADCSQIKPKSLSAIRAQIGGTPHIVRGQLDSIEIAAMQTAMYQARNISVAEKRRYGLM